MIGVIYARFSSHNQREESIEQQVAECERLAQREGISIVEIYADEALTGRSEKRRKNFLRMMRDAEKRRFEVVLAYKSARIARNMLNGLLYEARLAEYGIKTIYCKEEFADNAAGRFAFRSMMNLNQFYSENLSEDIKRGMLYNAEHCMVNGALPLGYKKAATEEELKKDVLNLIGVLSSLSYANESFIQKQKVTHNENVVFPIHAYLYLIKDFLSNGYYFEKEVVYEKSTHGKANWTKTVKHVKPFLQDSSIFYTEFITSKIKHNENQLISQIHQYCVWESFSKIGWLFSSFIPVKPRIKFNKSLFLSIIKSKVSQTFNEKTILLFNYMIDVIEFLDKSCETKKGL